MWDTTSAKPPENKHRPTIGYRLQSRVVNPVNTVMDITTGKLEDYQDLIKYPDKGIYIQSLANEFGSPMDSLGDRIKGIRELIPKGEVMLNRNKIMYRKINYHVHPHKEKKTYRSLLMGGGGLLLYGGTNHSQQPLWRPSNSTLTASYPS